MLHTFSGARVSASAGNCHPVSEGTLAATLCRALHSDDVAQLFFHISEVIPLSCERAKATDLRNILRCGDEVQFVIQPSRTDNGKLHAKRVQKLVAGTINPEEVDPTVRRGCVCCDQNGDLYIAPSEADAALPGHAQPIKKLKFSRTRHVRPGSKPPQVDDVVEFNVVIDKIRGSKRAKNIEVIAEMPSEASMAGREVVRAVRLLRACGHWSWDRWMRPCTLAAHAPLQLQLQVAIGPVAPQHTEVNLVATGARHPPVGGGRRDPRAGNQRLHRLPCRRLRGGGHVRAADGEVRGELQRRARARGAALREGDQAAAAGCGTCTLLLRLLLLRFRFRRLLMMFG
jgi:hypothetical protein